MFSFSIRCLEDHLPLFDDIITIWFLAIIPRYFAGIWGSRVEWLGIFVDIFMKSLFETTRAFPKFNKIFAIFDKEVLQFIKNSYSVRLKWMRFAIKYFLCSMDGISDDDNFWYIFFNVGLINTASNCKQFYFCAHYKCCIINCFDEGLIGWIDMQYRCSDIVLYASIGYDKGCGWGRWDSKGHFIEFLNID